MTRRSVSSEVDVAVDPATAFDVFTAEIDLWWVRGPINNWDSARVVEMRCEPRVGGRLLEIYDASTGDALELARITVWEPGVRLAWQSSLDDVGTEVRFEPSIAGTLVRVEATIPDGGTDEGGTAFVRVTPAWFGAWCEARDRVAHELRDTGRLGLAVYYERPGTAARWLRDAFGFEPAGPLPEPGDETAGWTELRAGGGSLMVFARETARHDDPSPTHVPWVFVNDLDTHFAIARAAGARIVSGIEQHGYRAYTAEDSEGHRWTFAQARPTMRDQ